MKNNQIGRCLISDDVIEKKAKQLNVEVLERFPKNGHSYLRIKCLVHLNKPEREVELHNFLNRSKTCGCMLQKYTIEDLKSNPKIRGDLDIIGEYKNNSTPILCKCKICGIKWLVTPNKLTQGRCCPSCCANKLSSGERMIFKYLKDNNIVFEPQKSFEDCINPKTNRLLRFDFYLPEYNLCIEFQGKQHYEPVVFRFGDKKSLNERKEEAKEKFASCKERDEIKRDFCEKNNIYLLEIKYTEQKDCWNILSDYITNLKNP